jgi:hypothetical protein
MTHQPNVWRRNTEGMRKTAHEKAKATRQRVEDAIRLLLREQRTINFKTVAETAHVSTAWLYANEDIKMRIIHLRSQQVPKVEIRVPPRDQASSSSKDSIIAALQKRAKEQEKELRDLRKQLEVAYGQLQKQYLQS